MKDVIQSTTKPIRPYTGLGSDLGDSKGRCLFAGTWNADIYPPLKAHVQDSDLHCAKNRMSGLWTPEQPLWKTLKEQKKTTVLFTGVNTDQCVLGTFVDGYNAVSQLWGNFLNLAKLLTTRAFSNITNTLVFQRVGIASLLMTAVEPLQRELEKLLC
jgi:hypothetical protein